MVKSEPWLLRLSQQTHFIMSLSLLRLYLYLTVTIWIKIYLLRIRPRMELWFRARAAKAGRGPGIRQAELEVGPGRYSAQPGEGAAPQHLPGARVSGGGARSRVSRVASREVSSLKVLRRGPGFRNRREGELAGAAPWS